MRFTRLNIFSSENILSSRPPNTSFVSENIIIWHSFLICNSFFVYCQLIFK